MTHFLSMLAQTRIADDPGTRWTQPMIGGAILIGLILVGGAAIMLFRRRVLTPPDEEAGMGFTLDDLRQLKESGGLSEAEYEAARVSMTRSLRKTHALDSEELSLGELREMLEAGTISAEQFTTMRKAWVERLKGRTEA